MSADPRGDLNEKRKRAGLPPISSDFAGTTHALRRTSPTGPGMKFSGTCILCGTPNLPSSAALELCANPRGLMEVEALVEILEGDD